MFHFCKVLKASELGAPKCSLLWNRSRRRQGHPSIQHAEEVEKHCKVIEHLSCVYEAVFLLFRIFDVCIYYVMRLRYHSKLLTGRFKELAKMEYILLVCTYLKAGALTAVFVLLFGYVCI